MINRRFHKKRLLILLVCFVQIVMAQSKKQTDSLALAYYNAGLSFNVQNNFSEAFKYLELSARKYEETDNKEGLANVYNILGLIYFDQGNYEEAIKKYRDALNLYGQCGSKTGIADSYNKISRYYDHRGNYSEALKNSLFALKLMMETGDSISIATCYCNIGGIYSHEEKYPEALKNFNDALKIREALGIKLLLASSYNDVAHVYMKMGDYSQALINNEAALKINQEINNLSGLTATYENIGEIYYYRGNYPKALKIFLSCLEMAKQTKNSFWISVCSNDVGKVFTELGKSSQAKYYLLQGLSLSKQTGLKENIKYSYKCLSRLDSSIGNYQQALAFYKLYTLYKDSLFNETISQQIAQLSEQYESEKKDKAIELLSKEKDIQQLQLKKQKQAKNYFIAGLLLFIVLSFFIYRNYHTRQKLKLLSLRNKIATDLHDDVGSTLSSISIFSQMAQEQSKETVPMLETIGESSRKMLDAMADIVWTIKPENDQFEKIIMRMKSFAFELLGAKNIDFEFIADEEVEKFKLPMEIRRNLYLIFKEATNNLVKYSGASRAMFAIKGDKNSLTMIIKDDGKGFNTSDINEGNGLKNMKRRAMEIGADFMIDSHPGDGTTIQLKIAV